MVTERAIRVDVTIVNDALNIFAPTFALYLTTAVIMSGRHVIAIMFIGLSVCGYCV